MRPLTQDQFRDALNKGLGRAVLHAREHGLAGVEGDVLHACLHMLGYDPQSESERTEYLFFLLDASVDKEFFRQPILRAVREAPHAGPGDEYRDLWQALDLALTFAKRGDQEARQALYERFHRLDAPDEWIAASHIVQLDGIAGLLHVANVIGASPTRNDGFDEASLVGETEDRHGRGEVRKAICAAGIDNPNVQAFWNAAVASGRLEPREPRGGADHRPQIPSLQEVLSDIESGDLNRRGLYMRFGRYAEQKDIEHLYERLLAEARPIQQICYLWVFRRRPLPQMDTRILEWAQTRDAAIEASSGLCHLSVQDSAIKALSHTQEPALRELALRLLRDQWDAISRGALKLFRENYQPGDHHILLPLLARTTSADEVHAVAWDVLDIAERQDLPELSDCMLWTYEHDPCANCRRRAFAALVRWKHAPAEVVTEAMWDCDEKTRESARGAAGHRS